VILEYAAERFAPEMLPNDPLERARQRMWVEMSSDVMMGQYKIAVATSQSERDKAVAATRDTLKRFESTIKGSYFAGDAIGLVDFATGPALVRLAKLDAWLHLGVFRDLPKQTNFPMDVLISYDSSERLLPDVTLRNQLWILYTRHTMFVKFKDPQTAAAVNADLHDFAWRRSPEQDLPILERNHFDLRLQRLTDVYLDPLTGGANGDDFTRRNTYFGIWILSLLLATRWRRRRAG
jgi:hypothetical protein